METGQNIGRIHNREDTCSHILEKAHWTLKAAHIYNTSEKSESDLDVHTSTWRQHLVENQSKFELIDAVQGLHKSTKSDIHIKVLVFKL